MATDLTGFGPDTAGPSPEQEAALELNIDRGARERLMSMQPPGPSVRQQTQSEILSMVTLLGQLGNPFSTRRIPFSVMRDMTEDPMLAFALFYIVTPLIRADYVYESPDAQLAAAADAAFRPTMSDRITKFCNILSYGYQPAVRGFQLGKLSGTYRDPQSSDPEADLPIWESENVEAILPKQLTVLAPENCMPRWDDHGEFDGFYYSQFPLPNAQVVGTTGTYVTDNLTGWHIPREFATWFVNEQSQNFGSIYGSPRTKRAYRYYWSYWFRWALADRSFENKADPAKIVYFPTDTDDALDSNDPNFGTGTPTVARIRAVALALGQQARSGATLAIPGDFVRGDDGKLTGNRKWELKYLDGGEQFDLLDKTFQHLDVLKVRCLTADTPIDCPRDHRRFPDGVPISMLKPGDPIWTFNTEELKFELRAVKEAACTGRDQQVLKIALSNGKSIRATPDHPFLTTELLWKTAGELVEGERLIEFQRDFEPYVKLDPVAHGAPRTVGAVSGPMPTFEDLCDAAVVISIEPDSIEDVWDVVIDGPDECRNFVAGGVVVHNSMFIPEQALLEGRGGTSSRNVAAQLGEVYQESQQIIADLFDTYHSENDLPQWVAANFPEKYGTPIRKVTSGLGALDAEMIKQIITLVGQVRGNLLPVDIYKLLEREGFPMLTKSQQEAQIKQIAELQAKLGPPETDPTKVGSQGYNAGVMRTETGETKYFTPPQRIVLAESFLDKLPDIPPYRNPAMRTAIIKLRKQMLSRYRDQLASFKGFIADRTTLKLAQQPRQQQIQSPPSQAEVAGVPQQHPNSGLVTDAAVAIAATLVTTWLSEQVAGAATDAAAFGVLLGDMVKAAGVAELKLAALDPTVYDATLAAQQYTSQRVDFALSSIDSTVRDELKTFLVEELTKTTDPAQVAADLDAHFAELPDTHVERVVRSEARDAYNFGMLRAGLDAGLDQCQAHDATEGSDKDTDPKCRERNGKIFSLQDALLETEHPNGTLHWSYLATENLSLELVDAFPEHLAVPDDQHAAYDPGSETLYVSEAAAENSQRYLLALGDQLGL